MEEYPGEYEIVIPSASILCQPTVAVVDEVVDYRDSREVATEYISYLYSDEAQRIEAENYYRPVDADVFAEYVSTGESSVIDHLPEDGKWIHTNVDLTEISHFGSWADVAQKHFSDGGIFDQIYEK
jgi:sulfate transport system substrate-binding protein